MRIYITKADTVAANENNLVDIRLENGEVLRGLEPRRLFPVSNPNEYITLLNDELEEIAMIRSVRDLTEESRAVINHSLEEYYLVPEITRIVDVVEKYGNIRWTVETDRGQKTFDIRNRNHDIRIQKDGKIRVRDSNDNRYTIENWHSLDKHSISLLMADL